jgi:RNA polymerase sigma-70 factor (ECF subfamily)
MTKRRSALGKDETAADREVLVVILGRVANRDEAAFVELYRLTCAKLSGVIAPILRRQDGGAEALQDTFVSIWEKAGDFDPVKGSPIAWMATIARSRALDEVRRARPVFVEALSDDFELVADRIDPLASRERSERLVALIDCLSKMDQEKRAMLLLAYYHGASREALSKRFGRPVPTIKNWLRRSLDQLRDCLEL